jgi:parallel beta-helix repeat protein
LYDGIASNNDCHLNGIGIQLSSSTNNTVSNNNCSSNTDCGIKLYKSGGNRIYLNNFINPRNVCSYELFNTWKSTSEINYVYNRSSFAGYLGNYWSDYTGEDTDGDGIGDAPYTIDPDYRNEDDYPLMARFENYVISKPIYVTGKDQTYI